MNWIFVSNRSRDTEVMVQRMLGEGLANARVENTALAAMSPRSTGNARLDAGIKILRQNSRHGCPRPARG